MKIMDVGRVCYKSAGRQASQRAVIVEVQDKNKVTIVGPQIAKQTCNIKHLWPTDQVVKVSKSADQKAVAELLKKSNE